MYSIGTDIDYIITPGGHYAGRSSQRLEIAQQLKVWINSSPSCSFCPFACHSDRGEGDKNALRLALISLLAVEKTIALCFWRDCSDVHRKMDSEWCAFGGEMVYFWRVCALSYGYDSAVLQQS